MADPNDPSHALQLNPGVSASTTVHTLTPAQHVAGVAGGNIYLDLKARLRDETAVTQFTATIDSLRAGGTIDLLLQDSVQETGAGGSTGVRVTTLNETTVPPPSTSRDKNYTNIFRPDGSGTPTVDLAAFGGSTETKVDSLYDFRNLDGAGNRTVAGVIAGKTTGNIIVKDGEGAADTTINGAGGLTAPTIDVLALSDLLGTGHIDVNVGGSVNLTENSGDLRVGLIRSRGDDVTLTSLDGSIVDAKTGDDMDPAGDTATDVVGVNITLLAAMGGIGSTRNFLEIDSSNYNGSKKDGLLDAEALNGI